MTDDGSKDQADWMALALIENVRRRRIAAYFIDVIILTVLITIVSSFIMVTGFFAFGFAWLALGFAAPLTVIVYTGFTLGGDKTASPGMQMMDLTLRRIDAGSVDIFLAVLHLILFYFLHGPLSPLVASVSLFSNQKRLLHDIFLGTVMVRRSAIGGDEPGSG